MKFLILGSKKLGKNGFGKDRADYETAHKRKRTVLPTFSLKTLIQLTGFIISH